MSQLIDRRLNVSKKSMVNRQRFLRRYKTQIKHAVMNSIAKRGMTGGGETDAINIPAKDLSEPRFGWGAGGVVDRVLPGNRHYSTGEEIPKPEKNAAGGSGSGASQQGEGDDPFVFQLTREEFLELYFDDLELPDLVKKDSGPMNEAKIVRSGVVTSGPVVNMNVVRSMRQAVGRRMALRASYKKKVEALEKELEDTGLPVEKENLIVTTRSPRHPERSEGSPGGGHDAKSGRSLVTLGMTNEQLHLIHQIEKYKRKINAIPFIDEMDLRYNHRVKVVVPATRAVMFCVMDVSGSMDEMKKELAKQFFILLYLFLTKSYEKIELVFIRHHTVAKEVDEQTFFYARETGGTVVSSALELLMTLVEQRYDPQCWNIYVAQASDGDNWNADSPYCQQLLRERIMPIVQYYAYIEVMPRHHQSLWDAYEAVQETYPNFVMKQIDQVDMVYPVFRELFKRKGR